MYIKSKEACKILGICANTLREMADEGKIATYQDNGGTILMPILRLRSAQVSTTQESRQFAIAAYQAINKETTLNDKLNSLVLSLSKYARKISGHRDCQRHRQWT
jgi:excisionase family DNA binding protein